MAGTGDLEGPTWWQHSVSLLLSPEPAAFPQFAPYNHDREVTAEEESAWRPAAFPLPGQAGGIFPRCEGPSLGTALLRPTSGCPGVLAHPSIGSFLERAQPQPYLLPRARLPGLPPA
ncbi:unnamed protein product [Rangifer tarandus platyrhynchus]|uniref:Uncharacterized protein n=1 Tax=Rangifer tarandus platyrhynchus TaxID=3082113 RepID=A0AC59ZSG7_RANTA